MSNMSRSGWQNNIKQVIRIALIGLKPSQQIIVKGYLRVLLRVDFDIEWVPPKNKQTELYIINHEYMQSDSVINLIADRPAPVLYVARDDTITNTIENDVLYLKLEEIKLLQRWLFENVPSIAVAAGEAQEAECSESGKNQLSEPSPVQDTAPDNKVVQHETAHRVTERPNDKNTAADGLSKSHAVGINEHPPVIADDMNQGHVSSRQHQEPLEIELTAESLELLTLVNLHNENICYEVVNHGNVIALIQPKKRLVWAKGNRFYPAYTPSWRIRVADQPEGDAAHALNLHSWLLTCALHENSKVNILLPTTSKLLLKTWPKPVKSAIKSELLKILSLLELRASSVSELSEHLGVEMLLAHRVLAGLYLAGYIDTSSFPSVDVLARSQLSHHQANEQQANDIDIPTLTTGITEQQNKQILEQKNVVKQRGFGGILSRIRTSLGF